MRNKQTTTLTPEEVIQTRHHMSKDIISYNHISMSRSVIGGVCITLGISTSMIPFTTIPLIMLGSWLLGYDGRIVLHTMGFYTKGVINWLYGNRNISLIKRTLKARLLRW